jgi:hypothetical protein
MSGHVGRVNGYGLLVASLKMRRDELEHSRPGRAHLGDFRPQSGALG